MQCVLVLNAMRFDAKCNAKASVLASIFCCCRCKFGTNFLQREMQKHSKWQKVEEKARNVCCCFYHSGAFYIGFSRCCFLEWFGEKTHFVKYAYHFNKSLKTSRLWHLRLNRSVSKPASALRKSPDTGKAEELSPENNSESTSEML